jgi:hypothetical protein
VVETIRLESGHTLTGIGGSNPSLSASNKHRHSSPSQSAYIAHLQTEECEFTIEAYLALKGVCREQNFIQSKWQAAHLRTGT